MIFRSHLNRTSWACCSCLLLQSVVKMTKVWPETSVTEESFTSDRIQLRFLYTPFLLSSSLESRSRCTMLSNRNSGWDEENLWVRFKINPRLLLILYFVFLHKKVIPLCGEMKNIIIGIGFHPCYRIIYCSTSHVKSLVTDTGKPVITWTG